MPENSQYIVSARKYRPDSFEDLIGQDAVRVQRINMGIAAAAGNPAGTGGIQTGEGHISLRYINVHGMEIYRYIVAHFFLQKKPFLQIFLHFLILY